VLAELQDLLPGIINQLGPDNLANLKKLAETYQGGAPRVLKTSGSGPHLSPPLPRPSRGPRAHHTPERHPLTTSARAQYESFYFLPTGNPPPGANADDDDDEDVPDLVDNFEEASK
jgi:hypothetical protein